jgi:hypothetical protein
MPSYHPYAPFILKAEKAKKYTPSKIKIKIALNLPYNVLYLHIISLQEIIAKRCLTLVHPPRQSSRAFNKVYRGESEIHILRKIT